MSMKRPVFGEWQHTGLPVFSCDEQSSKFVSIISHMWLWINILHSLTKLDSVVKLQHQKQLPRQKKKKLLVSRSLKFQVQTWKSWKKSRKYYWRYTKTIKYIYSNNFLRCCFLLHLIDSIFYLTVSWHSHTAFRVLCDRVAHLDISAPGFLGQFITAGQPK